MKVFAVAVLFLCSISAPAQTFRGSISGTLSDSTGAALPEATVKLDSPATGLTRTVVSSATGEYLFPDLPVGTYSITATHPGFAAKKIDNIEVAVSKVTNLNIQLGIAQQQQVVEVSATAVTLETTSTALVGVVNTKTVADLPMNGRDFRQMIKLAPGVSPSTTSVNGMRTSGNNYQIDGADNNDAFQNAAAVNQGGVSGIAGTLLPIEAIDQFSVQSNAGAEVGRNGGSSINLVIKSGTNDLHGSLYYFNRNEALASRSPFQSATSPKAVIRNNQFGFSLGGPIKKNRTFYFVNGESQLSIANNTILDTIPSDAWVTQAKGVLAQYGVPVNPVSLNLLTIWPASIRTGAATNNNYLSNGRNDYNSFNGIIKIDHRLSDNHSISARYFGGTGTQTADVGSHIRDFFQVAPSHMHNFSVVENAIFTPRVVNQLTLGVNYFLQTFNDFNTGINPAALGLNTGVTDDPTLIGSPKITISGFDYVGATQPLGRIDTTGHITDNLTWAHGRHQLKFGGEYRRAVLDVFYNTNKRGSFTFDGTRGPWSADAALGGNLRSLADFLAGYPSNSSGAVIVRGQLQRLYYQNSFDYWAHDTFQVSPKLSLNFGVRYTYHGVLHDDKNSITNFVPGRGFVTPGSDISSLYPKDFNNFAPRFGFAYKPTVDGKTVIRGGWGIYYDVPALNFFVANTGSPNGGAAGVHANPGGANPVYTINAKNVVIQDGVPVFGSAGPVPPVRRLRREPGFPHPLRAEFQPEHPAAALLVHHPAGRLCGQHGAETGHHAGHQPADRRRPAFRPGVSATGVDRHDQFDRQLGLQLAAGAVAAGLLAGPYRDLQLHLGTCHRRYVGCPQHHPDQQLRPERRARIEHLRYPPDRHQLFQLPIAADRPLRSAADAGLAGEFAVHLPRRLALEHPGGHQPQRDGREPRPRGPHRRPVCGRLERHPQLAGHPVPLQGGVRESGSRHVRQHRPQHDLRAGLRIGGFLGIQEDFHHRADFGRVPPRDLQPAQPRELREPEHYLFFRQFRPDHIHAERRLGSRPGLRRAAQHAARPAPGLLINRSHCPAPL